MIVLWYVLLYSLQVIYQSISFLILKSYISGFYFLMFFKKNSTTTDFPSVCVEWISVSLSCSHAPIVLLRNSLPLPMDIGLHPDSLKTIWNDLVML